LHHGASPEEVQADFHRYFQDVDTVDILLIAHECINGDAGLTLRDMEKLLSVYSSLYGRSMLDIHASEAHQPGHPVQIFQAENQAFQAALSSIQDLFQTLEDNHKRWVRDERTVEELKELIFRLGQFVNHYDRKEKLFFPILERHGYFMLTRTMWANDDRIRNLYKGIKSMLERISDIEFKHIKKTYALFSRQFKDMIYQEETFLLPVVLAYFKEDDWLAIAKESEAFGYAMIEPEEDWIVKREHAVEKKDSPIDEASMATNVIPVGGGFLTIKEANHILNNLPEEITFVDKHGVFKYFNDEVTASEMMFVRTPSSIGRNILSCHPPKSMKKVRRLIHDLQTKRRMSESMWFKKDGRYVHITYKALFDE